MIKKSIWIFSFCLFATVYWCSLQIPQEYVWRTGGGSAVPRYLPSTARMGSIINLKPAKAYVAQPVVEKIYTSSVTQSVVSFRSSKVHSYGGSMGMRVSGNVSAPALMVAERPMAPVAMPVASSRAMAVNTMHRKATMRKPQVPVRKEVLGNTVSPLAMNSLSLGYEAAASYMAPVVCRAPGSGIDNALNNWLISGSGSGALLYGDATTGYYYDMAILQDLFNQMQANGDMPGMTWEQFIDWFTHGSQNRHFAPMGDAWWLLALLALGYAIVVRRKYNRQTMKME